MASDIRVFDGVAWVSLKGPTGNNGAPGASGTITIAGVTALAPGATPTVTDSNPDPSIANLTFGIPAGAPGTAATVTVGTVTPVAAGGTPTVTNSGSATAAVLNFGLVKGDKGDVGAAAVIKGTASVYPPSATPAVNDLWILDQNAADQAYDSGLTSTQEGDGVVWSGTQWVNVGPLRGPQGVKGDTGSAGINATVSVGTVTTGAAGSAAVVTDGDLANPNRVVLNMTLPRGDQGLPGTNAQVYNQAATPTGMNQGAIWILPALLFFMGIL
jgi:hypothetical protein